MNKWSLFELIVEIENNMSSGIKISTTNIWWRVKIGSVVNLDECGHDWCPNEISYCQQYYTDVPYKTMYHSILKAFLINFIIVDTKVQRGLIKLEKEVDPYQWWYWHRGYWNAFKRRNKYLIVSKEWQKYELDRLAWTPYSKFHQTYDKISEVT